MATTPELPPPTSLSEAQSAFDADNSDTAWQQYGQCRQEGINPRIFEGSTPGDIVRARQACGACAVQTLCLDFGIAHGNSFTMWGGHTPDEIRAIRREQRQSKLSWLRAFLNLDE